MAQMYPAQSYEPCQLGMYGRARFMLLRQFQFPFTFEISERFVSKASDRLDESDSLRYRSTLTRHTGDFGEMRLENWLIRTSISNEQVFTLLTELLRVEATGWTGFRVCAGVEGNGLCTFRFELFQKREGSATQVYTGEDAPNVKPFTSED